MRKFLSLALLASLLLNAFFLLQRRREPPAPPPPVVQTKVVEKIVERKIDPEGESRPRSIPDRDTPKPAAERRHETAIPPSILLSTTSSYAEPGGAILVTCTVASGTPSPKQWIGLFALKAPPLIYAGYQMMNGAGGSFTFKAPPKPGDYEFRYILEDNETAIAVSNPVRVLGDVPVPPRVDLQTAATVVKAGAGIPVRSMVYSGKRLSTDWIGLYTVGAKNQDYVAWKYVSDADVILQAPAEPGTYEMRYLLDNGYESVATSVRIQVVP
jgi:hypothetical protein